MQVKFITSKYTNAFPANNMPAMAYDHLKRLLKNKRETQADLAKLINRTPAVITSLFKGERSLQTEEVNRLATHFGVSSNYILYGSDTAPGEKPAEKGITQADMAIVYILRSIIALLMKKNYLTPSEMEGVLNHAGDLYRVHQLPDAKKIVDAIRSSVTAGSLPSEQEVIHKLLELSPLGSA